MAIDVDSPLVLGNRLTLLEDGPASCRAMFAAMRAAKDHIHLETCIFEDDDIGQQFADLQCAAAHDRKKVLLRSCKVNAGRGADNNEQVGMPAPPLALSLACTSLNDVR